MRVVRRPPNTGTKGINRALEQHGKDIPDGTLRVGKVSGTIIHETAHLLDRAQGWISKKPDSPFGKGDKLTPGRSADYASDYAKTMPEEDFAETVRVVVELGSHKTLDPDLAGPISDILRQKYLRAAQEIGADPAVLQRLPGWVE